MKGDLSKIITNIKYNDDLASLSDEKLLFDFAEEMHFDEKASGIKSTIDRSLIRLLESPVIMPSGISTILQPENLHEPCDRTKWIQPGKQARISSNMINEEIVATNIRLLA